MEMLLDTGTDLSGNDSDIFTDTLPDDSVSNELTCQVCGVPLTYGGRGRKPKFCADHKPTGNSGTKRTRSTNVDTLIGQITDVYVALGSGLTFIPPTAQDGYIISQHATSMAESWRPLIERDPKIRKFWERICTGGGWGTVLMAHGVIALSIMQAHNVSLPFGGKNHE